MQPAGLRRLQRSDAVVFAACAASLLLGLFFVFVWAPHPWGWEGFDHYHELALTLAAGEPFPTMEVPWGYAYFAAALYGIAGDHPAIVLVVQVLLNAALPWLVYRFALTWTDRPTARLAAVLTGIFSFNTVYASTQSSDAVSTVIFMTALVVFAAARLRDRWTLYAAAGVLTGIAAQFRPNLIVIPPCLAAFAWLESRSQRRALQSIVLLACAAAALAPWVARNYRLTRTLLPTSVHGGVQLWYGTLQVGPYLHSRAYNPRAVFEAPVFDYTSLEDVPLVVDATFNCTERVLEDVTLTYRLKSGSESRISPARARGQRFTFEIPPPGADAVVRYYLTATWSGDSERLVRTAPPLGSRAPFVYFVARDHLGDLDVDGDLLDLFDVVRLMRRTAWNEEVPFDAALRAARIGDERDAVTALLRPVLDVAADRAVAKFDSDASEARLSFSDGSAMTVPRTWRGRVTELTVTQGFATTVMSSRRSLAELSAAAPVRPPPLESCLQSVSVAVNEVFYRREPQMMRRYMALAIDNIRRDPAAFLRASAYRSLRLFIVEGASDAWTAQQFSRSRLIYAAATAASAAFVILCAAGVVIGWRRHHAIWLPLLLILSVPLSLAPVLINMRYTVTIQPLMFVFAAIALTRFSGE